MAPQKDRKMFESRKFRLASSWLRKEAKGTLQKQSQTPTTLMTRRYWRIRQIKQRHYCIVWNELQQALASMSMHTKLNILYGQLTPITKTIQVRRTRHAGHCWKSRDELISDVLLWTPTYGQAKAGQPARNYIQQLCEDTGCNPEDLPKAMNHREKWQERVRDICAGSTTWWWWWWWQMYGNNFWWLLYVCEEYLLVSSMCHKLSYENKIVFDERRPIESISVEYDKDPRKVYSIIQESYCI